MAKLYFRYGAMGSSKTANAIMVQYNYQERGQSALMLKPRLDDRDGARIVGSRSGLTAPCHFVEELDQLDLSDCDCIIVDEAQFLTKAQVQQLVEIVDDRGIPVICYGLRADFQGNLFEGSQWLMAWADTIEEIKTVCWCGRKATTNARLMDGKVVKSGAQIVLGGNESYVALCRKHWARGELAPFEIRRISNGKNAYMALLKDVLLDVQSLHDALDAGELYVLFVSGQPAASAIITAPGERIRRISAIAAIDTMRHKGHAGQLLRHIIRLFSTQAERLEVISDANAVPFFEHFGFRSESECGASKAVNGHQLLIRQYQ